MGIFFILILIIILILLLKDYKTGGIQYVFQEPSPFGAYSKEDCYVACSEKAGQKEACDWCNTNTLYGDYTDENIRNTFDY